MFTGCKDKKLEGWEYTLQPSNFQLVTRNLISLVPLALHSDCINLDVQHDEAPELIQLEVHPELFRFGKFLFHGQTLLFGD